MNQFSRVAVYLSTPYWCVYSARCRVRLIESHSALGLLDFHLWAVYLYHISYKRHGFRKK